MKFVHLPTFTASLKKLGATPADIAKLQLDIASNPLAGDMIQGLRGLRKIRFAMAGKGKSGGGRAIYFLALDEDTTLMVFAFRKSVQEELTPGQRRKLVAALKEFSR